MGEDTGAEQMPGEVSDILQTEDEQHQQHRHCARCLAAPKRLLADFTDSVQQGTEGQEHEAARQRRRTGSSRQEANESP